MSSKSLLIIIIMFLYGTLLDGQEDTYQVKEIFDIPYIDKIMEDDTLRRVNFFLPQNTENPPLLIWITGGAWSIVDRYNATTISKQFAKKGIAVAAIGHSLSSCVFLDPKRTTGVKHPAHIKDLAEAFNYLYNNAQKYGYNQNKIFVGGFSSGAHLSTLLACDEKYLKSHGLSFENISGIIPVSGAYDISHYHNFFQNSDTPHIADQHVKAVFGDTEEHFKDASPTTFVDKLSVPMLLFSDSQTYKYTTIFENSIRDKTDYIDFDVINCHKLDHAGLWREMSREGSLYTAMAVEFVLKH